MKIGEMNILKVKKRTGGLYILGNGSTVEVQASEFKNILAVGEKSEVFVINDRQASARKPYALVGDFAVLKVKLVRDFGVFLDWGISKDLFLPNRNIRKKVNEGDLVPVYLLPDFEESGVIATTYINDFFNFDTSELEQNQKVSLQVYEKTDLGYNVYINNRYTGIIYFNEIFLKIRIGDKYSGYIKKIRSDGAVDAALQMQGYKSVIDQNEHLVIDCLEKNGGFLPLHDKSSPQEIYERLQMSKKNFKKAAGSLYKKGIIIISSDGITKIDQLKGKKDFLSE